MPVNDANDEADAWILSIKSRANSVNPPSILKRRVLEQVEMKNEKGNILATLRIDSFQEDDAMDTIIRSLKPGMGKGIYVSDLGEKNVSQQTNYQAVKWLEGLEALKEKASPWKPSFPTDAQLIDIRVFYGFDNLTQKEIDEMIAESERTGKNVVVRDLKSNNTLVGVSVIYRKEQNTFDFRIFGTTKSRIHVPNIELHTIEHLIVRGNEAVYVGDIEKQQLIWAEEEPNTGKALQYELLAERTNRDWVISIAESLS